MIALPKPLNDLFRPPPTPGVLGVFAHLDTTLAAIKRLRAAGHTDFTVYSPIPRHEIEDALGQAVSPVRMFTLIGGIAGCAIGAWITLYMSYDWPLVVGGKPIGSIPPYVVIMFEMTILFGALSTILGIGFNAVFAARREHRVEPDAEDRRERPEQDRHLEHDYDIGRDRADRLAAHDEGPVVRHVERDPRADRAARDAADQREHAHGADGLAEGVLDLVARDRRVHGEVGVPALAQLPDRLHCGVEMGEHAQHARRGRRMEQRAQRLERVRELHTWAARPPPPPRRGAGRTSLTSEIDTAGKFLTHKRNHMTNQPKLPAMIPQS